eukprot:CAMPEP_0197526822 /NCGR_PEP_ID=MMETSP1318-20131121/19506_1 /TAXON_ID=552666 /ORGANISM="Partenskyella glossopodia, Strain RCC365" /LENGTH=206 /DNA_ID=CAMNT_0043081179 /DNA_START=298 /DNA_END=918 /DNA_ORIENTATION=-
MPLGFLIGRWFQSRFGSIENWGGLFFYRCIRRYVKYATALRKAFESNPLRLCAFYMWSPLPAQFEPFLLGAATLVPLSYFMCAGYPSKSLQGCLMALMGMQAKSLGDALDSNTSGTMEIVVIVLGPLLTILLMVLLGYFLRKELRRAELEEAEESEVSRTISEAKEALPLRVNSSPSSPDSGTPFKNRENNEFGIVERISLVGGAE